MSGSGNQAPTNTLMGQCHRNHPAHLPSSPNPHSPLLSQILAWLCAEMVGEIVLGLLLHLVSSFLLRKDHFWASVSLFLSCESATVYSRAAKSSGLFLPLIFLFLFFSFILKTLLKVEVGTSSQGWQSVETS